MTWIEGFGDEVVFFVVATTVVVSLVVLAWKSTDVPDPSPPQTPAVARRLSSSSSAPSTSPEVPEQTGPPDPPSSTNPDLILSHQGLPEEAGAASRVEEVAQVKAPLPSEESEGLRRRKTEPSVPVDSSNNVCVRLKYMDDSFRVVESSSSVTLGDFKRAHFQSELSANKVVKLIFNGQVLSEDTSTLSQLGLENNCVVHCLVHQARPTPGGPSASSPSGPAPWSVPGDPPSASGYSQEAEDPAGSRQHHHQQQGNAAEAGIDIGGLLVPLLGVILGLVWYCRIAYSAHFTAAATTALVGLSGICIVSVFLVWYPIVQEA